MGRVSGGVQQSKGFLPLKISSIEMEKGRSGVGLAV
jgi:hypothetical protein